MDDGLGMDIPLWAQKFFYGFPWTRARILSMLLSLPSAADAEAPQHQLRCPFFLCLDRLEVDACNDGDVDPAFEPLVSEPVLPSPPSGGIRRKILKPTKYGRCVKCFAPRKPWVFKTGRRGGQAAWVCTHLFGNSDRKCFQSEPMTLEEIEAQPMFFRKVYNSLTMRLKRGGRMDWQSCDRS